MKRELRVLFLADTHLGFDLPERPRVQRRRRGDDFFRNYDRVLARARGDAVDCVVHGGDLLYRSRVSSALVERAFVPLRRVVDAGIPVLLVPGNHERSRIPHPLIAEYPGIHIFHDPRTVELNCRGLQVAFAGFPFIRERVRSRFQRVIRATGVTESKAALRILCMHQAVEGARVGPSDYTFRRGEDVIAGHSIPGVFAALLSGHIHRAQILERDLQGSRLRAPVFYAGSIERTAFAEKEESKGYFLLEFDASCGRLRHWRFEALPARPMIDERIWIGDANREELEARLRQAIAKAPADAVLRLTLEGGSRETLEPSAAELRRLAPPTMNLSLRPSRERV